MVRSANARLYALAVDTIPRDQLVPFLCECADAACLGRIDMKTAEYDDIHQDPTRYAVLRHHQLADGETVVERRQLFDVVGRAQA